MIERARCPTYSMMWFKSKYQLCTFVLRALIISSARAIDRDWRHSRWRTKSFLRAAETNIDVLLIHGQRNSAECGDGVDDEKRAKFVGNFAEQSIFWMTPVEVSPCASPKNFNFLALAGAANIFGIHGLAVRRFHAGNIALARSAISAMRSREPSIHRDDRFVAGFQRIKNRRFDSAGAGSGNRKSDFVCAFGKRRA